MARTRPGERVEAVASPDSATDESAIQTPGGPLQNRKSPHATTNLDNIGEERSPTDAPPPQNRRESAREGFDALGDAADAFAGASAPAASSRRSSNPQRQKNEHFWQDGSSAAQTNASTRPRGRPYVFPTGRTVRRRRRWAETNESGRLRFFCLGSGAGRP